MFFKGQQETTNKPWLKDNDILSKKVHPLQYTAAMYALSSINYGIILQLFKDKKRQVHGKLPHSVEEKKATLISISVAFPEPRRIIEFTELEDYTSKR